VPLNDHSPLRQSGKLAFSPIRRNELITVIRLLRGPCEFGAGDLLARTKRQHDFAAVAQRARNRDRPVIFAKPERGDGQNIVDHEFAAAATDQSQTTTLECCDVAHDLIEVVRRRATRNRLIRFSSALQEPPLRRGFVLGR